MAFFIWRKGGGEKNLTAIIGVVILILFYAHAEGAIHIPNSEIQVFGTTGWGMPDYGDPAYTLDENIPRYWDSWDLSQGEIYYLSYKFSVPYSITQIDFYSLPNKSPYYFMGELDIQISQNSTDGIDGDWTTVDHIDGDFIPGDTYFSRYPNTQSTSWIRLRMEYQGQGAWGSSPAFYLNEIDFYGDPVQSPISNAGPDQVVFDEVTLDGSASHDPDGSIESYEWKLEHKENSDYDRTAGGVNPTITALEPGFYDVTLTVTNDGAFKDTDTMLLAAAGPCVCTATTMHIESIIAGTARKRGRRKYGKVTVTILDEYGSPVSGANVTGTFTGDYNETITGTTGTNGKAVITTSAYVRRPSYTFCVDDVSHGTLTYDSNDNIEDCKSR